MRLLRNVVAPVLRGGTIISLLIWWVSTVLTCLARACRLLLRFSSSRCFEWPILGLNLVSSWVVRGLAGLGTTRLTAPAALSCSVSVVEPVRQPSRLVVLCMCPVTPLLPAWCFERMWEIAVPDMCVNVVMLATESAESTAYYSGPLVLTILVGYCAVVCRTQDIRMYTVSTGCCDVARVRPPLTPLADRRNGPRTNYITLP